MKAPSLQELKAAKDQHDAIGRLLPLALHKFAAQKIASTDMSIEDVAKWSVERSEKDHEVADKVFTDRGFTGSWKDAQTAVAVVASYATVLPASDLFLVSYDLGEIDERPKVINRNSATGAVVVREFSDADLEEESLMETAMVYLSAAKAMKSLTREQKLDRAPVIQKHCEMELTQEAVNEKIHGALTGSGWL